MQCFPEIKRDRSLVICAYNLNHSVERSKGLPIVQPGLYYKFQARQGYRVKSCLKIEIMELPYNKEIIPHSDIVNN